MRFHSQIFLPNWKGSCSVHHCCIQVDLGKVTLSISACLFIFQFDFSDGSIQILLRDNLQQIGSVDLPRSGNLSMNQSSKNFRSSVTICDMSFSSTGNALVTIGNHHFWIYVKHYYRFYEEIYFFQIVLVSCTSIACLQSRIQEVRTSLLDFKPCSSIV